jgi:tetratricopeptide (TPR) repeat protein
VDCRHARATAPDAIKLAFDFAQRVVPVQASSASTLVATFDEAWNEARRRLSAGQFAEAEPIYRQLLAAAPQVPPLWQEMGIVHLQSARPEQARECLEKAVALEPHNPAHYGNLGIAYRALKRYDDAATAFRRAIADQPTPPMFSNLGLALKDGGRTEEALEAFNQALSIRPDYATALFNRANLLLELGRLLEAKSDYARVVALNPADAGAWCKMGVAHFDLAEMDDAQACFDRALVAQPNYPEARRNRAMVWLTRHDYARGWPEWEARHECEGFTTPNWQPRWLGEPIAGQSLLVHAEQGLGDTLHFVRYLPLVEKLGCRVQFEAQPALVPLLRQSGFDRWLTKPGETPSGDWHCPLLSLPGYVAEGPQPYWGGPYLEADPAAVSRWQARLAPVEGFRVGIVWAGNPDHPHDRFRSVPLGHFAPLAAVPGVRLVSLQKGVARSQLAAARDVPVVDLGDDFDTAGGAFCDTAAAMRNLHLVVTVDTAVAHLAGGMGVPVWVPLQLSPDWRWGLAGDRTPWYPSMRLYRQNRFDQWRPVFEALAEALRATIS